jgi:hypothetical protein
VYTELPESSAFARPKSASFNTPSRDTSRFAASSASATKRFALHSTFQIAMKHSVFVAVKQALKNLLHVAFHLCFGQHSAVVQ